MEKLLSQVVIELRELVSAGELRLTFSPTDESTSVMVTAHDAGYACEEGCKSQAGYVLAVSDQRIQHQQAPFCVLEYCSHGIKRAVRPWPQNQQR
eukprot:6491358-Amphidinium_carterae.4